MVAEIEGDATRRPLISVLVLEALLREQKSRKGMLRNFVFERAEKTSRFSSFACLHSFKQRFSQGKHSSLHFRATSTTRLALGIDEKLAAARLASFARRPRPPHLRLVQQFLHRIAVCNLDVSLRYRLRDSRLHGGASSRSAGALFDSRFCGRRRGALRGARYRDFAAPKRALLDNGDGCDGDGGGGGGARGLRGANMAAAHFSCANCAC